MFLLAILRAILSLLLGALVFLGLLAFLLVVTVRDNFLSADFYTDALTDNDIYNRVYDDLFTDPDFAERASQFMGDFAVPTEEIAGLARQILPPDYLQTQVEGAVNGVIDYLNGDTDTPRVFIDVGSRLDAAKDVLFPYIDDRVDEIRVVPALTVDDFRRELEVSFRAVQNGQFPTTIPSLDAIPVAFRSQVYDQVFTSFTKDPSIAPEVIVGLQQREDEIKALLETGDVKEAVKVASRGLGEPLMDNAFAEIRKELDSQGRLDLVARVAEANDKTVPELLSEIESGRDWIERGRTLGGPAAAAILAVAAFLMGILYLPRWRAALRWPGLALLLSGAVFLAIGMVLNSQLADRLESRLLEQCVSGGGIAPSICSMGSDIIRTVTSDVASGFTTPSIMVMVIGGALLLVSILISAVSAGQQTK